MTISVHERTKATKSNTGFIFAECSYVATVELEFRISRVPRSLLALPVIDLL